MDGITFASLLNAAGAGIAAVIITSLVQVLKAVAPALIDRLGGALVAFVLSAVLYLLAGIATAVSTFDAGLNVFLAWLTCATAAVGTYSTIRFAQARAAGTPPEA